MDSDFYNALFVDGRMAQQDEEGERGGGQVEEWVSNEEREKKEGCEGDFVVCGLFLLGLINKQGNGKYDQKQANTS